ncbi:hypothetical protein F2P79_002734 [Pimephales promelas]|nr:hypothetical protein F2P79_002734 [Pimephales promelas]
MTSFHDKQPTSSSHGVTKTSQRINARFKEPTCVCDCCEESYRSWEKAPLVQLKGEFKVSFFIQELDPRGHFSILFHLKGTKRSPPGALRKGQDHNGAQQER